jgi:hypothetical protein
MVFNATFNNISALLLEETEGPGENQVADKLYHILLYISPWSRFELTSVVIGIDWLGSCKSNYHTITAMTAPNSLEGMHISKLWGSEWPDINMLQLCPYLCGSQTSLI